MADVPNPDDRRAAPGLGSILADLVEHLRLLVQQEAALFRAEMAAKLKGAALGAAVLAVGVTLLASGFFWLVTSVVLGLATLLPAWLAALVMGGVIVVVGAVVAVVGLRFLLRAMRAPERTARTLKADIEMVKEKL